MIDMKFSISNLRILLVYSLLLQTFLGNAQQGRKIFYRSDSYKDKLFDGLISDAVVSSSKPVYVAVGTSVYDSNATGWIRERARFIRTDAQGTTQANLLYTVTNASNQEQRADLLSIAERVNTNTMTSTIDPAFVLTGSVGVYSSSSPGINMLLLPVNQNGNPLGSPKGIDFGGNEMVYCTRQSKKSPDFFYTCGKLLGFGNDLTTKGFIIRHNGTASTISWVKVFSIPIPYTNQTEVVSVVEESSTGNIIVVGNALRVNPTFNETCLPENTSFPFIAKFNSSGTLIWCKVYDHLFRGFYFSEIRPTNLAQEFIITGDYSSTCGNTSRSPALLRVNTSASTGPTFVFKTAMNKAIRTLSTDYKFNSTDVVTYQDSLGAISYYISGALGTTASGVTNYDGYIIKADALGQFVSMRRYKEGSANERLVAIDNYRISGFGGSGPAAFGFAEINAGNVTSAPNSKGWLVKSNLNLSTSCNDITDSLTSGVLEFIEVLISPVFSNATATSTNLVVAGTQQNFRDQCWSSSITIRQRPGNDASPDKIDLTVIPNPALGNKVSVFINTDREGDASLRVTNALYREVINKTIHVESGQNHQELDLSGMASGIYMIHLTTSDGIRKTARFVKN